MVGHSSPRRTSATASGTGWPAATPTPEYRVGVRTAPQVEDFRVTYRAPKYAALPVAVSRERKLKALRGSEAVLTVRTNRVVREARLEFSGTSGVLPPVRGDRGHRRPARVPRDVPAGRKRPVPARLRVRRGEPFTEPGWQNVEVVDDQAPAVELTKPGRDVSLPADGDAAPGGPRGGRHRRAVADAADAGRGAGTGAAEVPLGGQAPAGRRRLSAAGGVPGRRRPRQAAGRGRDGVRPGAGRGAGVLAGGRRRPRARGTTSARASISG